MSANAQHLPRVLSMQQQGHQWLWQLEVAKDCPYFEGHFPDHAILPGVTQVHWLMQLLMEQGFEPELQSITQLKFNQPIEPGARLQLSLTLQNNGEQLNFKLEQQQSLCSQGQLRLRHALFS